MKNLVNIDIPENLKKFFKKSAEGKNIVEINEECSVEIELIREEGTFLHFCIMGSFIETVTGNNRQLLMISFDLKTLIDSNMI